MKIQFGVCSCIVNIIKKKGYLENKNYQFILLKKELKNTYRVFKNKENFNDCSEDIFKKFFKIIN